MRQKRLFLDQRLTASLIESRFGSVDGLVTDWSTENPLLSRERASIYKWMTQGVPTNDDALFGFASILDVDPVSIIDYQKLGFFSKFYQLRRTIQLGFHTAGPIPSLLKMYEPSKEWPTDWLAMKYFSRNWTRFEFNNEVCWNEGKYALIRVVFRQVIEETPRTVHISYRRTQPREEMWRPYGWVIQDKSLARLYAESGDFQSEPPQCRNEIHFRTYFGARSVEFRLASLHDFTCEIEYPSDCSSRIGFDW